MPSVKGGAGESAPIKRPRMQNPDSGRQRLHPRHVAGIFKPLLRSADCGRRSGRTRTGAQRNAQYRSQRCGNAQHVGNGTVQTDKSDFNTCHIPVVLLTARTAIEQNIEGLRIGADDYITKPFNTNH